MQFPVLVLDKMGSQKISDKVNTVMAINMGGAPGGDEEVRDVAFPRLAASPVRRPAPR